MKNVIPSSLVGEKVQKFKQANSKFLFCSSDDECHTNYIA
jgi:hypothetical protein